MNLDELKKYIEDQESYGTVAASERADAIACIEAAQAEIAEARQAMVDIFENLQQASPWAESNDMDFVDEIICGIGILKMERDELAAREAQARYLITAALESGLNGSDAYDAHEATEIGKQMRDYIAALQPPEEKNG